MFINNGVIQKDLEEATITLNSIQRFEGNENNQVEHLSFSLNVIKQNKKKG